MPSIIQETSSLDSSGYSQNYNSIMDLLTLPDTRIQALRAGEASQAYLQAEGSGLPFDHDTFVANFQAGHQYRLQITPAEPDVVAYNKMATVYAESGGYLDKAFILNTTGGYVGDSIYSDIFVAPEAGINYIGVSLNTLGGYGSSTTINSPYTVTLLDLSAGDSASSVDTPTLAQETVEQISLLYSSALDRKPDVEGLNYWIDEVAAGQSLGDISLSFVNSEEFNSRFDVDTDQEYIEQLYFNVLDRQPDQAGVDYWLNDMQAGQGKKDVLLSFAQSAENRESAVWLADLNYDAGSDDWLL